MNIQLIALLHDMLKPYRHKWRKNKDTYYDHHLLKDDDMKLINELKNDIKLSNKEFRFLKYVIYNHHLFKMVNIKNRKTIFNCAYSMKKDKEFFRNIIPILWGDFDNFDRPESKELFEEKINIINNSIDEIETIEKNIDFNEYTSGIKNKHNIQKMKEKMLKKAFVTGKIILPKEFKGWCDNNG